MGEPTRYNTVRWNALEECVGGELVLYTGYAALAERLAGLQTKCADTVGMLAVTEKRLAVAVAGMDANYLTIEALLEERLAFMEKKAVIDDPLVAQWKERLAKAEAQSNEYRKQLTSAVHALEGAAVKLVKAEALCRAFEVWKLNQSADDWTTLILAFAAWRETG